MRTQIVKSIIICFIMSIVVLALGLLIAIPITDHWHYSYDNVVFIEGIAITVFSLFFSIPGNPPESTFTGLGYKNDQYLAVSNVKNTLKERSSADYIKNFTKNTVMNLTLRKFALVFGGVLLIICSALGI